MTDRSPEDPFDQVYQEMARLLKARDHEGAVALLQRESEQALAGGFPEDAAQYQGLLATALTIAGRDSESLEVSLRAETLDPENAQRRLDTANILLTYLDRPADALSKVEEARGLSYFDAYSAAALLGTARLLLGEKEASVAAFREISSPAVMEERARAGYVGVFDLRLVHHLIEAGLAAKECRTYLATLLDQSEREGSAYLAEHLRQMLGRIG